MSQRLISIGSIASEHGRRRQSIHKLVKRLGIDTVKIKGEGSRGQASSHITERDYKKLLRHLDDRSDSHGDVHSDDSASASGVFYLILLEPERDPGRLKVGYTANIEERMRSHKTVAPFASLHSTWPCKSLWERAAIECVTQDCEQLHTEVFRTEDIEEVIRRADQFFRLMPNVPDSAKTELPN